MKKLIQTLLREGLASPCDGVKITSAIADEIMPFETAEQFLRSGGLSNETLDRAAWGFTDEDITTLMPSQLHIKWKEDWKNVRWEQQQSGLSPIAWSKRIDLSEPIDVVYENDKFFIDDGHHRFFAAKVLKKPLNVSLTIKQNPIEKLGNGLTYDDYHRCIFSKVKGDNLNEQLYKEGVIKLLSDDEFIHFTSMKNGLKILREKSLGIEGWSTFAVSAKWGIYNNAGVLPKTPEVAILFKTDKLPKYGYLEEVIWDGIIPLTAAKGIQVRTGVDMLKKSEVNTDVGENDRVMYK